MIIREDYSYIKYDLEMIELGLLRKVPYSIRLQKVFTPEQQERNAAAYRTMGFDSLEYKKYIESAARPAENAIYDLVNRINNIVTVGQFARDKREETSWDLWFWCAWAYDSNGEYKRDYGYVTLSFYSSENDKDYDAKITLLEKLKPMIAEYDTDCVEAVIQWATVENTDLVNSLAETLYQKHSKDTVHYSLYEGKLVRYNDGFAFKKKYAKTKGYVISRIDICRMFKEEISALLKAA